MFFNHKSPTKDGEVKKRNFYAPLKTQPQKNAGVFSQHQNTPQQIVTQNQKNLLIKPPPKILDRINNQPEFNVDDKNDSWEYAMEPEKKKNTDDSEEKKLDFVDCSNSSEKNSFDEPFKGPYDENSEDPYDDMLKILDDIMK